MHLVLFYHTLYDVLCFAECQMSGSLLALCPDGS